MRKLLIISLLVLSGCTRDHYIPETPEMNSALSSCRYSAMHEASSGQDHLGALLGGGIGGIAGGAIGGVVESSENTTPKKDWNVEIENCMVNRGFSGVSTGYN